ncbi:MAG TPA: hypothetical protein VFF06_31850 [Polyangia bacterium]|nr:hypothetical protein [Polyangia bacterium]
MTDARRPTWRRVLIVTPFTLAATIAFALFLRRADGSRAVVEAFLAEARAGRPAPLAPDDAAARAIAGSRTSAIDNFIISDPTGCYWAMLDGKMPLKLFVEKQDGAWRVTAASLTRQCRCPKGHRCALDPAN